MTPATVVLLGVGWLGAVAAVWALLYAAAESAPSEPRETESSAGDRH
jgi:hypothetical protein